MAAIEQLESIRDKRYSRSSGKMREYVLVAVGFGCMVGFARICSLGFVGYLSYEISPAADSWYAFRTGCELVALAICALCGLRGSPKLGLTSFALTGVCAMASAIVFAVDTTGTTGPLVAVLGGCSEAVLMYVWLLLLSSYAPRVILGTVLSGLMLAGAIIDGAPLVGPDVGLVIAVVAAFGATACAVLVDPDLRLCAPDGALGADALNRIPWLSVTMVIACSFFGTVLYGVAEYMTWLYDWRPNYIVYGVSALAVVAATAVIVLQVRSWTQIVWVPLFVLFALAVVFACLPTRSTVQVAVGFLMAVVFASHVLCWMVLPSMLSTIRIPRAFAAGVLLVCMNSSLASLVGDALGSVLPRSMQNLGSVSGIMAIAVAVLFAVVFVALRGRFGEARTPAVESPVAAGAKVVVANGAQVPSGSADVTQGELSGALRAEEATSKRDAQHDDELNAGAINPADALKQRLDDYAAQYGLTPREQEVALFTVQGFSCAYIAEKLVVSNSTVRFHQQNIYRKFDVHSRNDLIELVSDLS